MCSVLQQFFNAPCKKVTSSLQKRKHHKTLNFDEWCQSLKSFISITNSQSPIIPGGRISLSFCTERSRRWTMFVKKSVKLLSVACQLLKKKIYGALFQVLMIDSKNITVGFTIFQWDSLITIRNDLNFWKNICVVKYAVFSNLALYILP